MKKVDLLAVLDAVLRDAKALKRHGKIADVAKIAEDVASKAAERARSRKVMEAVEAAMQADRQKLVPVSLAPQSGRNLRAKSIESREENVAFRDHVANGGVKRGEDSTHETRRYTSRDAAKLAERRDRSEGVELSDEALMRRIDNLATKSAKNVPC